MGKKENLILTIVFIVLLVLYIWQSSKAEADVSCDPDCFHSHSTVENSMTDGTVECLGPNCADHNEAQRLFIEQTGEPVSITIDHEETVWDQCSAVVDNLTLQKCICSHQDFINHWQCINEPPELCTLQDEDCEFTCVGHPNGSGGTCFYLREK